MIQTNENIIFNCLLSNAPAERTGSIRILEIQYLYYILKLSYISIYLFLDIHDCLKMSVNNRSAMFKSKSGRHFITNTGDERDDRKRNRHEERHKVYLRNRVIQPVTIDAGESNSSTKNMKIDIHDVDSDDLIVPQKLNENQNRQQQFREKFKRYLYKKANNQQSKAKVAPFFSAVAKGRFIDVEKVKNVEIKKKCVIPMIEAPKFEIPKFSPIVTRSKKVAILPAASSQLQTPKRKNPIKKESKSGPKNEIRIGIAERPPIKVKQTLVSCDSKFDKPNMSKALNTGALKKVKTIQSKPPRKESVTTVQRGIEEPKKLESKIDVPVNTNIRKVSKYFNNKIVSD